MLIIVNPYHWGWRCTSRIRWILERCTNIEDGGKCRSSISRVDVIMYIFGEIWNKYRKFCPQQQTCMASPSYASQLTGTMSQINLLRMKWNECEDEVRRWSPWKQMTLPLWYFHVQIDDTVIGLSFYPNITLRFKQTTNFRGTESWLIWKYNGNFDQNTQFGTLKSTQWPNLLTT